MSTHANRRPVTLADYHRSLSAPTDAQLQWLNEHGVTAEAVSLPWTLRSAEVTFLRDRTFQLYGGGEPAIIFRAEDRGETIDLVAWGGSGRLASWRGVAFCVGDQDQISNPATYFSGGHLHAHRTPIDWLKAGRSGIVIVQPGLTYSFLRNVPRLSFDDRAHARHLKAWIQPPKPKPKFFIKKISENGTQA